MTLWADIHNQLNQLEAETNQQISDLELQVNNQAMLIQDLEADVADQDSTILILNQQIADKDAQIADLTAQVGTLQSANIVLQQNIDERDALIGQLNSEIADRDAIIAVLESANADKDAQIAMLEQAVTDLQTQMVQYLPAPTLTATPGDEEVLLEWTPVSGATGYRVGHTYGIGWETIDPAEATSRLLTHFENGVEVEMFVQAQPDGQVATISATPAAPVVPSSEPSPGVWFSIPEDVRSHARKWFSHYFGPFPRSVSNEIRDEEYYATGWLNPNGESGKHASYGGYLRNRPIYREPLDGDFEYKDCEWDVQTAADAGMDGFFVDIMGSGLTSGSLEKYIKLRDAAHNLNLPNFYVVPMLDTNGSMAKGGDIALIADRLARFAGYNCSWYLPDGRFVVSSFKMEGRTPAWWRQVFDEMRNVHGIDVAFLSVALNFNSYTNDPGYADLAYGEGSWGFGGDPAIISNAGRDQCAESHSRGNVYIYPVNGQNVRPNTAYGTKFDEGCNTEAHRASWEDVIAEGADYVQSVTWSDFGEGGEIVPSEARGYCELDLGSWYSTAWKTGQYPEILRDNVILSHRTNPKDSVPWGGQTITMSHWDRPGRSELRDTVEALTFLTEEADVTIDVNGQITTYRAPAGQFARLVPLVVGESVSVSVVPVSTGVESCSVTSVAKVVASPKVDDKQYYMFSANRGTAGQRIAVEEL